MTTDPTARSTAGPAWFVEPTLGQRFVGWFLDGLLFLPLALLYLVDRNAVTILVVGAVRAVYQISLTSRTGRTVGKILVGTAALDAVDGSVIPVRRAVVRWFMHSGVVVVLSLVAWHVGGFSPGGLYVLVVGLTVLPAPLHRGLHDRAAGTLVTSIGPRPPSRRQSRAW